MEDLTGTMVYDSWGNQGHGLIGMVIEKVNNSEFDDWCVEWYHKHHVMKTTISRGSLAIFISDYIRYKKNI